MSNTLLVTGKGKRVAFSFGVLQKTYPQATVHKLKRRWWQLQDTYELRLHNLTAAQMSTVDFFLIDVNTKSQVF